MHSQPAIHLRPVRRGPRTDKRRRRGYEQDGVRAHRRRERARAAHAALAVLHRRARRRDRTRPCARRASSIREALPDLRRGVLVERGRRVPRGGAPGAQGASAVPRRPGPGSSEHEHYLDDRHRAGEGDARPGGVY